MAYNWLADPYSAALNPFFWKIHGYVDSLLDRWLQDSENHDTKNHYTKVEEACAGDLSCYVWKGMWTGTPLHLLVPPTLKLPGASRGPPPQISPEETAFKARRMALARLGVVKGQDGVRPPPKLGAAEPLDPYTTAINSVCRSNNK